MLLFSLPPRLSFRLRRSLLSLALPLCSFFFLWLPLSPPRLHRSRPFDLLSLALNVGFLLKQRRPGEERSSKRPFRCPRPRHFGSFFWLQKNRMPLGLFPLLLSTHPRFSLNLNLSLSSRLPQVSSLLFLLPLLLRGGFFAVSSPPFSTLPTNETKNQQQKQQTKKWLRPLSSRRRCGRSSARRRQRAPKTSLRC